MLKSLRLPIFLDNQSTTPVDERVLEAMMPFFGDIFGNPASKSHKYGRDALLAVEAAREQIGKAINAKPEDICFTSGATEAINLAIKGLFFACRGKSCHFISVTTEHKAVLDSLKWVEEQGARVTLLSVDGNGLLDPKLVMQTIQSDTVMVSVMAANNEIGVLQPLREIGSICRERSVFFMTDATQALGKLAIDIEDLNVDLLTCSAHKLNGPKGAGALFCRRSLPRVPIQPIIHGGGHERGMRSGTMNVPAIVGFAKAATIALQEMTHVENQVRNLRDDLLKKLMLAFPDIKLNGHPRLRLAGNLNMLIPGVDSESLIIALADDIAISTGAACSTMTIQPSHVLKAIGLSDAAVHSSIRIGIGKNNTSEEIQYAADCLTKEISRLRSLKSA